MSGARNFLMSSRDIPELDKLIDERTAVVERLKERVSVQEKIMEKMNKEAEAYHKEFWVKAEKILSSVGKLPKGYGDQISIEIDSEARVIYTQAKPDLSKIPEFLRPFVGV